MGNLSKKLTRAVVPLSNLPERTSDVDDTTLSVSVSAFGGGTATLNSNSESVGRVRKDANGVYYFSGTWSGNVTTSGSPTIIDVDFDGLTFDNLVSGSNIGYAVYGVTSTDTYGCFANGSSGIRVRGPFPNTTTELYVTVTDAPLTGKPSWFDANREAGFSIAAQVEEATDTTPGLLPYYKTETKTLDGDFNFDSSNTLIRFTRIGNVVTITAGAAVGINTLTVATSATTSFVPAEYRPTETVQTIYAVDPNNRVMACEIQASGELIARFFNSIYAPSTSLTTFRPLSISYTIT
jgi:hypothetical protein